jgi:hypothetical protein
MKVGPLLLCLHAQVTRYRTASGVRFPCVEVLGEDAGVSDTDVVVCGAFRSITDCCTVRLTATPAPFMGESAPAPPAP